MTLDTIERETTGDSATAKAASDGTPSRTAKQTATFAAAIAALVGLAIWSIFEPKIRSTAVTVIIAVAASAGIWIGANLLFNQVRSRWLLFQTIAFALIGAVLGVLLHGNLVTTGSGQGFLTWVVGPLVGALAFGAVGYVLATVDDSAQRLMVGLASAAVIGIVIGLLIREEWQPGLDPVAIIVYTAILGAIGAGITIVLKKPPINGALVGAAIGWIIGAWGGADLGDGSAVESIIAALVPALLIGYLLGSSSNPDYIGRVEIESKSRAIIFIGPAVSFICIMLVVPAIRTAYLSLLGRNSEEFVDLENYGAVFVDRNSFDGSDWTDIFTSVPFLIGIVVLIIAVVIGSRMKQLTGRAVEIGNPTVGPLILGALLVGFGVFTVLRGTLINNLWWVTVVTFASTALGLAIAVIADGRKGEKIAKSIIFMPMAISLVGASIIWRFVYVARDPSIEQTGVLNTLWVGLGKLSTGSGLPTLLIGAIVTLALISLLVMVARALTSSGVSKAVVPGIGALLLGWFVVRYWGVVGNGVGGIAGEENGPTIFFLQDTPYNNFWLMVIFIWIQTGFSMVILSAAIKAVPTELIEAAKIDGATTSQVFWRVTLPQIATTIGVVVTTLIVGVMKVFDIVKVTTNGKFDSQVLANQMFEEAFSFGDTGKGAALAILIFLSVLPVMVFNIRKMQQEA